MFEPDKVDWDKTADVVIVGYGMAGTVAEIRLQKARVGGEDAGGEGGRCESMLSNGEATGIRRSGPLGQ